METRTIQKNHYTLKWKSLNVFSGWRSLLSFSEPLYLAAQIQWKNSGFLAVIRNFLGGLVASLTLRVSVALKSLIEGWSNNRFRTGALIVMAGISCWFVRWFFSVDTRIDGFYYVNFAFYFNNVKPYLCGFFISLGFFIALPQKYSFRWWAIVIAFFCAAEWYDRTFVYNDPLDFQQATPEWRVYGLIALSVPAVFFSLNYLAYRKYHLKDGTAARILGVAKMKGVPPEMKLELMEQLAQEAESYNSRI